MALDFFQILGVEPLSLPDGGIYDPTGQSSLSYVGPEARVVGGADPNKLVVEGSEVDTGEEPGTINPTKTKTFVSGDVENTYTATDGRTFTNIDEYIEYQNAIYEAEGDTGSFIGGTGGSITNPQGNAAGNREAVNARAIFDSIFKQYFNRPGDSKFIADLTKFVEESLMKGYTAETISALLPQTAAYKERFKGNEGRLAAGLAAYSPAEYLQAEDTYAEILNRFNLGGLATREQFADLISNRKSASEVADLVQNVYFRIQNADPALRQQLNQIKGIGNLTDADLAQAVLSGKDGAQVLRQKIAGAEVATEAAVRGLSTTRSQELANLGVTREEARAGFEAIAQTQPTLQKLAGIYDKEVLAPEQTQVELEKETFQGMQSQRRKRLAQQEQAAFMGSSGTQGIGIRRTAQSGLI